MPISPDSVSPGSSEGPPSTKIPALPNFRESQDLPPASGLGPLKLLGAMGGLAILIIGSAIFFSPADPDKPAVTVGKSESPKYWIDAVTRKPITLDFLKADFDTQMGEMFLVRRRYKSALSLFRDALAREPQHVSAQFHEGYCLMLQQNYKDAAQAFRKTLALQPDFPMASLYLARIAVIGLQWDEAVASYRREFELKKDLPVGIEFARLLQKLKKTQEAITLLNGLKERFPEDFYVNSLLMQLYNANRGTGK